MRGRTPAQASLTSVREVVRKLETMARPDQLEGMASFGMTPENRLGVSVPEMRNIARVVGKNHKLALALWKTGIVEARITASMIAMPDELTERQMEEWAAGFNSWDLCDQVCMNLFDKSPLAWKKIADWSERQEEYVKRAAFALIACLAWHDKGAADEKFIALFPVLRRGAEDPRNYVKKAVSWALRHIGKRSATLNAAALAEAGQIGLMESKSARWIASGVINELASPAVRRRLGLED